MAIARTQAVSANAASATLSSTAAGDLIVVFAYSTSTTIPSIPAGYTSLTATAGTQQACTCGWKVSAGGETSTGSWTNATNVVAMVYSGASAVGAIGALQSGSSTAIASAGPTYQDSSGASWGVFLAGAKSNTAAWQSSFSAYGVRTSQTTIAGYDTGGGFTGSPTGGSVAISPTSRWFCISIEIKVIPPNPYLFGVGAATAISGTAGFAPAVPSGYVALANDIAVVIVQTSNQVATATTAGFAEIDTGAHMATGTAATAGSVRLAVFWKRYAGGETTASFIDTSVAGDHCIGQVLIFRDCATSGNPFSDVGTGFISSTLTQMGWYSGLTSQWLNGSSIGATNTFSTTVNNSLVVYIGAHAVDSATGQATSLSFATLLSSPTLLSGVNPRSLPPEQVAGLLLRRDHWQLLVMLKIFPVIARRSTLAQLPNSASWCWHSSRPAQAHCSRKVLRPLAVPPQHSAPSEPINCSRRHRLRARCSVPRTCSSC